MVSEPLLLILILPRAFQSMFCVCSCRLLPHIKGNVGFVFTKNDLTEVRKIVLDNRVAAPAKAGAIAPLDVSVTARNTGLGPEKTSFFQALAIPTKITKGTIEILNDVQLIKEGEKVGASEATLLGMLNIHPFSYGLIIEQVYDSGTVFHPSILDISDNDLRSRFMAGITNIASISLAIGYPTVASAPHSIINGFKNLLAIAAVTDVEFKEAETVRVYLSLLMRILFHSFPEPLLPPQQVKEFLKDPSKFAAAVAAAAPAAADEPAKEEAKKEESEEESDDDMGFGLFD